MRTWRGNLAVAVSGVEAYRPISSSAYAALQLLSDEIISSVTNRFATEFTSVDPDHAQHVHVVSTNDFDEAVRSKAVSSGRFQPLDVILASNMNNPASHENLDVSLAGLQLNVNDTSVEFGYSFSSPTLAREVIMMSDVIDCYFLSQPSLMIGGFLRDPGKTTPGKIKNAVKAAFSQHQGEAKEVPLLVGPLAIHTF